MSVGRNLAAWQLAEEQRGDDLADEVAVLVTDADRLRKRAR
jgi:hypothetical protein